jgi:hypothetical protein
MKMAKANAADLDMAMELCGALDGLTQRWFPTVPEKIEKLASDSESEQLDLDDAEQCERVLRYLLDLADRASLARVVYGCAVMLDPRNQCVDPAADTIQHHPDTTAGQAAKLARPLDDWDEEMGAVLWWKFPVEEAPTAGTQTATAGPATTRTGRRWWCPPNRSPTEQYQPNLKDLK